MKFLNLLLCIILFFSVAFAQDEALSDSAYSSFRHGKYTSAIKLYKQLIAKTHHSYQMFTLATCYARMDSVDQEKKILREIINLPNYKTDFGISADCCFRLADIYLKERNFDQALSLYNLYGLRFNNTRSSDVNWLAYNLEKENARSKCFEGLGKIDSAIDVLTPYIFCSYKNLRFIWATYNPKDPSNLKDSLKQDSVCARYLALLRRLHSNSNIKAELRKAETSFYNNEKLKYESNGTWLSKDITCGFKFYGTAVIFDRFGVADYTNKLLVETKIPFYTKTYQLMQFRRLPLCRMIRDLPGKNY